MQVISLENKTLNSFVSIQTIDGVFGLVMESRGGAKGKKNERNTDYKSALSVILERLKKESIETINIYIVSSKAVKIWSMEERIIKIDGSKDINIAKSNIKDIHKKISAQQVETKENSLTKGGNSTKKILIYAKIDKKKWQDIVLGGSGTNFITEDDIETTVDIFNPINIVDAKERVSRSIAIRRGQLTFRKKLLMAYQETCAISDTKLPPLLEAAHIVPYQGTDTNIVTNGILLRADIHTLFDLGLLGINQNYEVVTSPALDGTEYKKFDGRKISLPQKKNEQPSLAALAMRPLPSK